MVVHSGIHVFINSRKIQLYSPRITGNDLLRKAGFSEAGHWNLYRLQNENDLSGGTIVYGNNILNIKDGDWFRVIEGHESNK